MGHQDTKQTSMRPRLKELNDIPYIISHLVEELHSEAVSHCFIPTS